MKHLLSKVWNMARIIANRFIDDRLTYSASALTFTTLLALVPLVTVSITILSAFPFFHTVKVEIRHFIFHNFIPASGVMIQQYLEDFVSQAGKLSLFGTVLLVATAILMMLTIERAFNNIWKIKRRREGLPAFLRYWAALSLVPIFFTISIATTSYVISLPFVVGTATSLGVQKLLFGSVPIILMVCLFTFLYVAVPNCKVPFRHGLIAALVATLLFQIAKRLFVVYVTHIQTYRIIYGAMAAVPIFLVWLYLLWVIILFGALISNVLATSYFSRRGGKIDGFTHAFLWLGHLWKAQNDGLSLSLNQLHRLVPGHYLIETGTIVELLRKARLIQLTNDNTYVLARDFSDITVADLYDVLPWKLPNIHSKSILGKKIRMLLEEANHSVDTVLNIPLDEAYRDLFG